MEHHLDERLRKLALALARHPIDGAEVDICMRDVNDSARARRGGIKVFKIIEKQKECFGDIARRFACDAPQ